MKLIGFFILALSLVGCASITGYPERAANQADELSSLTPYFSPSVITTYDSKTDSEKIDYRDEVVHARIRAININYNSFLNRLSSESKSLTIGTDSAVLLLGGAGAVSTVSSTQAILSATSAFITGTKASFDKNAFYDSTVVALVSQMNASRKEILARIYSGLELNHKKYSLMKALIDVEDYFQAGTILGALNAVSESSGEQKAKADKKIESILEGAYIKDLAGDKLRAFWKPDGTINTTNETKINQWMQANSLQNVSITSFIRNKIFEEARVQAVNEIPVP